MHDHVRVARIKIVEPTPADDSPSVARALSVPEASDLATLAKGLPLGWVVVIEPPYGQVSIQPARGRRRYHRCYVASRARMAISRDDGSSVAS